MIGLKPCQLTGQLIEVRKRLATLESVDESTGASMKSRATSDVHAAPYREPSSYASSHPRSRAMSVKATILRA